MNNLELLLKIPDQDKIIDLPKLSYGKKGNFFEFYITLSDEVKVKYDTNEGELMGISDIVDDKINYRKSFNPIDQIIVKKALNYIVDYNKKTSPQGVYDSLEKLFDERFGKRK